jgi:hypothetical protein
MSRVSKLPLVLTVCLSGCQISTSAQTQTSEATETNSADLQLIEPISGLPKDGLVARITAGNQTSIIYNSAKITKIQLGKSAAKICALGGTQIASTNDTTVHHPDDFPPNTRHYIILCQ